ncbi:sulfurtransferase TusA family protein [Microbispora sp. RL4-1S]|uniref:Sulfurtransferase TusA family protein n=1 Tax=Microbispora oryzae TaxID=2806554 RepID=A0A941AG36_9ACTN|nr:sulfurtransferase TusA family protein [Microbispora oryzae]MBP2702490.1 sulfurtransferase TusA family protein [Microbispora oryzae]
MWRRRTAGGHASGARPTAPAASPEPAETPAPAERPSLTIDALGRKCPIPIIMLAEQINNVPMRDVVAVLADDPAAYTDVPAWCRLKSHEHVGSYDLPQGGWAIHVRRNY